MKRKILIILPIAVLLLGGLAFVLERTGVTNLYQSEVNQDIATDQSVPEQKIDYTPATATDNEDINKQKEDGFAPSPTPQPTETAVVTITRANASPSGVQINALISGLSDGACSASLTQDSTTLTATAPVSRQDTYTYCDAFSFNPAQVTEGKWQVSVTATSSDAKVTGTGTSELEV